MEQTGNAFDMTVLRKQNTASQLSSPRWTILPSVSDVWNVMHSVPICDGLQ